MGGVSQKRDYCSTVKDELYELEGTCTSLSILSGSSVL